MNLIMLFCHPALDAGSRNIFFSLDPRFRGDDKCKINKKFFILFSIVIFINFLLFF